MIVEVMGIGLMLFLVMIPRTLQVGTTWSQELHSLYLSLAKFLFVIGLSLTILPSLLGCKNSMVMFMMDTSFFNFIAKISFCTYLLHLIIMEAWVTGRTYNHYYEIVPQFADYAGILTLSLFCGLIMTLLIEAPFAKLQKLLVNNLKKAISGQNEDKSQS
jgi:peptidoglycan/LPS O-acetylase OafA/YrhL